MKRNFTEENIWMANKRVRSSTWLVIRAMQITTTLSWSFPAAEQVEVLAEWCPGRGPGSSVTFPVPPCASLLSGCSEFYPFIVNL